MLRPSRASAAVLQEREEEYRLDGHSAVDAHRLSRGLPLVGRTMFASGPDGVSTRIDDQASAHARRTAALIRAHRVAIQPNQRTARGHFRPGHGVRSRIPRQRPPVAIESEYAASIIGLLERLRGSFALLFKELPELLDGARRARGDAADPDLPRRSVAGIDLVIENPAGSSRKWRDIDGTEGETTMAFDYGFIAGAVGADGDAVDVFVGPVAEPSMVYVIRQRRKEGGFVEYDEDKVMLGFETAEDAFKAYLSHYDDHRFFGGMLMFRLEDFKARLVEHAGGKITHGDDIDLVLARTIFARFDADDAKRARDLIERARRDLDKAMAPRELETLAGKVGQETSAFQRGQLQRQTRAALGIDLATADARVPTLISHFTSENVSLIRSLGSRYVNDVEKLVSRAFTSGTRHEDLAKEIEARFGVHERHARLIARDQIGKLNGQVNVSRQRELGIQRFIWRTVDDERVREEHAVLDGQEFDYDDPPDEGLPGEPINCRCSAEPIFDDVLEDADGEGDSTSDGDSGGDEAGPNDPETPNAQEPDSYEEQIAQRQEEEDDEEEARRIEDVVEEQSQEENDFEAERAAAVERFQVLEQEQLARARDAEERRARLADEEQARRSQEAAARAAAAEARLRRAEEQHAGFATRAQAEAHARLAEETRTMRAQQRRLTEEQKAQGQTKPRGRRRRT